MASRNLKPKQSTQQFLDLAEIRDDVVVMKDGTFRSVILVSSLNFSLKSEEEQEAIIASYISFLNSIDFPLQIVIQSRQLDIGGYLVSLEKIEREQTNELLKMQTNEYIQYVRELVELSEIMTKKFYIVIRYNPIGDKSQGFFTRLFTVFTQAKIIKVSQKKFLHYREELLKRVDLVTSSLVAMGISAAPLDTQSLIELYYKSYNPIASESQKLTDVGKLQLED